jgi:hypothetical protein
MNMFDLLRSWAADKTPEDLIVEKISSFKGTPYAQLPRGVLHLTTATEEDSTIAQFTIMADLNIYNYCGCLLVFQTADTDVCFRSRKEEVFTFYSENMRIGLTTVEFDLTSELGKLLDSRDHESVTFIFKGGAVTYSDFLVKPDV